MHLRERKTYARAAALVTALSTAGTAAGQLVTSDFTLGPQGWTVADNGGVSLTSFPDSIGTVDSDPANLAFVAPAAFLGDLSLAYRGTLSFELRPSVRPFQPSRPSVELTGGTLGPMGTPLILSKQLPPPMTFNAFTPLSVALSETAEWIVVGEARAATAQELRNVLGDIQDLRILADSSTSTNESIRLRNVRIDRPTVRVVIAAGQSNMSGCAHFNLIPEWDFTPRHDLLFWHQINDAFEPLTYGSSDSSCGHTPVHTPDHYGPEIGFADTYIDLIPDSELVLIKFTDGGTSLHVDWVPPGMNPSFPNGGALYNLFYDELDLALAQLDALGYQYEFEGAIWMQGESDADRAGRANPHQNELTRFIADLREYTGNPTLPYIIGRVANNNLGFDQIVRAAQVAVADADPYACWVDTDDLPKLDFFHYNEAATLLLGERFAKTLRRLTTVRGDANLDGVVDVEDLYHWNQNPSDENCDGVINAADLEVVMIGVRGE